MAIGSAFPAEDEPHAEIRGRDLVSGLPKTVVISAAEVRKAIEEPVNLIVDAVKNTLDKCPPELAGDVMDRGIALTGGGALLRGLDERLREETGMPIHMADNPLDSVVLGTGKCVEDFDTLSQVLVPESRRRQARRRRPASASAGPRQGVQLRREDLGAPTPGTHRPRLWRCAPPSPRRPHAEGPVGARVIRRIRLRGRVCRPREARPSGPPGGTATRPR